MTTSSHDEFMLYLAEYISTNLAFRDSADDLFKYLNSLDEPTIIVDFSKVITISSSFAHQYIVNTQKTEKRIIESNMPNNIRKMFDLVKKRRYAPIEVEKEPMEVINVGI